MHRFKDIVVIRTINIPSKRLDVEEDPPLDSVVLTRASESVVLLVGLGVVFISCGSMRDFRGQYSGFETLSLISRMNTDLTFVQKMSCSLTTVALKIHKYILRKLKIYDSHFYISPVYIIYVFFPFWLYIISYITSRHIT